MDHITCPNCQYKTARDVVELRRTERAKWICDGASSIEEMANSLEQRAARLRELNKEGWELDDEVVRDDHAHLCYDLTEVDDNGN